MQIEIVLLRIDPRLVEELRRQASEESVKRESRERTHDGKTVIYL
jgi:hypothetical protein